MNPILVLPLFILAIAAVFLLFLGLVRVIIWVGEVVYDFLRLHFDGETAGLVVAIIGISTILGGLLWMGWMKTR